MNFWVNQAGAVLKKEGCSKCIVIFCDDFERSYLEG